MSYELMMSRIDNEVISGNDLEKSTIKNKGLKFDDKKSWTNLYNYVALYSIDDNWDFLIGLSENKSYAITISPDHPKWDIVCKIADDLNLIIYGEENEIYYIPNIGSPSKHLDFANVQQLYKGGIKDIKEIISKF